MLSLSLILSCVTLVLSVTYDSHFVPTDTANNITLHVVTAGVGCGNGRSNAIVMLHGFPEGWSAWLEACDYLAGEEDYCCVMPDLRGYNQSSAPSAVDMYKQELLVDDILHIFNWLPSVGLNGGSTRAWLFAHDWGGALSWSFTNSYPQHVRGLVGFDSPHPNVLLDLEQTSAEQRTASSYFLFFKLPSPIPESQLSANNYAAVLGYYKNLTWATPARLNDYLISYQTSGLTGGLNYYRANLDVPPPAKGQNPLDPARLKDVSSTTFTKNYTVTPPVMLVWGKTDSALLWPSWPEDTVPFCTTSIEILPIECGHFSEHRTDLFRPSVVNWMNSHQT